MARLFFGLAFLAGVLFPFVVARGPVVWAQDRPSGIEELQRGQPDAEAEPAAQGLGQLLIRDAQSGAWRRLSVARYHVNVVLHAPVALVQIDQTFYNPYDGQEEGTFVFNLPRGASVSRFAMYVTPTELIEGELVERGRASNVYESIVRTKRDPAILEQIGDNLFRMRVFPVPGRGMKQILLDFTVPLEPEPDGTCRFSLPLLSDLEPIWDFRVGGRIFGPVPRESIASPSHPDLTLGDLLPAQVPDDAEDAAVGAFGGPSIPFELTRQNYEPSHPFTLHFQHAPEGAVSLQTYRAAPLVTSWRRGQEPADPDSRYPLTYFRVELHDPAIGNRTSKPLDLLILADTSAAVRGQPEVAEAVGRLIDHLRPDDRVRLVCVDVAARPMHEGWLTPGSGELKDARERFGDEFCLGGADLAGSFREALGAFEPAGADRRRLVVYVGSGADTLAPDSEPERLEKLVRLFDGAAAPLLTVYVLGRDLRLAAMAQEEPADPMPQGRELLEAVALATGGLMWDAWDPAAQRAFDRWLALGMPTPLRITDVRVTDAKPDDLFFPTAWTPGEPFVILGRMVTGLMHNGFDVHVTTLLDGKPMELHYHLEAEEQHGNVLIGRLWAQRKLSELALALPALPRPDSAEHRRVVALSREWSVLSPLTAFLVLESERDYARWGIDRLRRRYWRPAGAADDVPLPQEWLDRVLAVRGLPADRAIRQRPREDDPEGLRRLLDELGHRDPLDGLGWQRRLFAPSSEAPESPRPSLTPLLCAPFEAGEDYERLFPHYRALLTPIDISRLFFTLDEFAEWLKERTGVPVEVDHKALDDFGLSADMKLDAQGIVMGRGELSLHSYVRHVLSRFALTVHGEPNRLIITTPEEAEARLLTDIYPVADLMLPDHVTPPELLADPLFDLGQAAEARIRRNLRQPISVKASDTPLSEILTNLATKLDVPLIIDDRALGDAGLDATMPVSVQCEDLPGEEVLTTMLWQQGLCYTVRDEALVVTTPEDVDYGLTVRLHSVRGVAYEYRVARQEHESLPAWFPGLGGEGGGSAAMGGGMAGGLGGGGGGRGRVAGGGLGGMAFFGGFGDASSLGSTPRRSPDGSTVHAGLSTGGELPLAPPEPDQTSEPDPARDAPSEDGPAIGDELPASSRDLLVDAVPEAWTYEIDFDSIIELITQSVSPHT
ncbi:MAG: VIT and VWA domain-containing protein [Thermoguttaceae bacterium]|jgi:hypothetical protein|nr:VIT and VWA domain-containing protein [Thermoguttaceae bacterium]